jgi:dolichyl-phosphate-mannose--protein O-mannosyl transferase
MHAELKFPGNVHLPKRMVPERSMSARRSMKLSGMIRIGLVEVLTLSTLWSVLSIEASILPFQSESLKWTNYCLCLAF